MFMCDCDAQVAFYDSRVRVAQKAYPCIECDVLIAPKVPHHYKVGAVYEDGSSRKARFWQAILCKQCERDWSTLGDAEYRETRERVHIHYGELRDRIEQAYGEDWLKEPAEIERYLRWCMPEPEEIGVEPRLFPGNVHPDEAWRLQELPFQS